jgi:hypothetical protein
MIHFKRIAQVGKLFAAHETGSLFLHDTVVGQFKVNAHAMTGSCRPATFDLMAGDNKADDMEHCFFSRRLLLPRCPAGGGIDCISLETLHSHRTFFMPCFELLH